VVLGVLVVGVVVWAALPGDDDGSARGRAHELATELRCPDCEGASVAESDSPSAHQIRADLLRRVRAGQSDASIRRTYVDRYGEGILLKPEGSGLGLLLWGLPVVVLVVGAAGIALALRRSRREPRMHATEADEALVDAARGDA
jgi:cytochrome c-type biogenesis protein CcmH